MTEKDEKKKEILTGPDGEVCRDLVCAEEWIDPANRKVISEYHKEGLPPELVGVEADLDTFEQYWKKKGGAVKVEGEYHKDGAPLFSEDSGWDAYKETQKPIDETAKSQSSKAGEAEKAKPSPSSSSKESSDQNAGEKAPKGAIQRPIDLGLIEMITYAIFRVAFSKGVTIPLKREGMVDMDITVKGKEITVNTNQLFFSVPELNVWHIVYTHKGKPIVEMGRGVKNGMLIHKWQAILLLISMWRGSRRNRKLLNKQKKEAEAKAHSEV